MHDFRGLEEVELNIRILAHIYELASLDGEILPFEKWPLNRILQGEHLHDVELRVRRMDTDWMRIFSYSGAISTMTMARDWRFSHEGHY